MACIVEPVVGSDTPTIPNSATSKQLIQNGPGKCPYHKRHKKLKELKSREFRVTSYNLLSDALAETEFSKDGLFPYCPEQFVAWQYREHLLLDEIIGYNSSVLCLQELDKKIHLGTVLFEF